MRASGLSTLLFVVYCLEAGVALTIAPWHPTWDRLAVQLPFGSNYPLLHPWLRAAVSGFGLVHLVWGFHDLLHWVSSRRERTGRERRGRDAITGTTRSVAP